MELVLIGGAPRSGTSALHALACTSPRTHPYVGECSYLSGMIGAYERALSLWESHTRYFFADVAAFLHFHRGMVGHVLKQHHEHLGEPEVLCLKNPLLTPRFGVVRDLVPHARFLVIRRAPLPTIQSRAKVFMTSAHRRPTDEDLMRFCAEYARCYRDLPADAVMIDYDAMAAGDYADALARVGLPDTNKELIWRRAHKTTDPDSPWGTELSGRPLTLRTFELDRSVLTSEQADMIPAWCAAA